MTRQPSKNAIAIDTREAYARWAPLYPPLAHNPLMRAEQSSMVALWPQVLGKHVLDLAAGSGRYSRLLGEHDAEAVVALDNCAPMLDQVAGAHRVCGTMMSLPFATGTFDAVICGLAVGHAADITRWMAEIARVLRSPGVLLYSDFHPDADRAGLPRSFKDQNNEIVTVKHARHELTDHLHAASAAGLAIDAVREVRVGIELQEPFSGSADFYGRWHGLPLVLIMRARK